MKKALVCLTVLTLAACSDYADWDKRGPDASGAEPQKSLVLPPDFFLRAPVESAPAPTPAAETATPSETPEKAEESL